MLYILNLFFSGLLTAQTTMSGDQLKSLGPAKKIEIEQTLGISSIEDDKELYQQVVTQLLSSLYIDFKSTLGRLESNYLKKNYKNTQILYENSFNDFCLSRNIKSKEVLKYQVLASAGHASAFYSICSEPSLFKESLQMLDSSEDPKSFLLQGNKGLSLEVSRLHTFSSKKQLFGYKVISNDAFKKFIVFTESGKPFIHVELDIKAKTLMVMIKKVPKTKFVIGDIQLNSNYNGAEIKLVVDFNNTTPEYLAFHGSHKSNISKLDFSVFLNVYFMTALSSSYANIFKVLEMQLPQVSEAIIQQNNKVLIEDFIVLINRVKQGADTNFVTSKLEQLLQSAREGKILDQRNSN